MAAAAVGGAAVVVAAVRDLGSGRQDSDEGPRAKSDIEWRDQLTRDQFHVLRMGGTENPFSGQYVQFHPAGGHFACAACRLPLYMASSKFESGCGWPAFDKSVSGSVVAQTDLSLGRVRTELICAGCGGHLGRAYHGIEPETPPLRCQLTRLPLGAARRRRLRRRVPHGHGRAALRQLGGYSVRSAVATSRDCRGQGFKAVP